MHLCNLDISTKNTFLNLAWGLAGNAHADPKLRFTHVVCKNTDTCTETQTQRHRDRHRGRERDRDMKGEQNNVTERIKVHVKCGKVFTF